MEIPNYDIDTKNKKKIKQLHSFMPHDTFRTLICGNSGSGKTNLLYHMPIKQLLYYYEIYLYAKNLDQEKYQKLMNKMNEISRNAGSDIMTISNDKIIPIDDINYGDNQKLVLFDDYVCEKNQRQIVDYFIQGRHNNCSVVYLSQSFYKTPRDIRLNCSHYCVYEFPSSRERNMISSELGVEPQKFKKATKEPYSLLYVDKQMKKNKKRIFYGNV